MSDRPRYYFAYGSNLHPLRLGLRTPSCRPLGVAGLSGYALRFNIRSDGDGSAKANAHYTGDERDRLLGIVYGIEPDDIPVLDRIEGLGPRGYRVVRERVALERTPLEVFLYAARVTVDDSAIEAWTWYRDLVWHGARWNGFPSDYLDRIARVPAAPDPDAERHARNAGILKAMPDWRPADGYGNPLGSSDLS